MRLGSVVAAPAGGQTRDVVKQANRTIHPRDTCHFDDMDRRWYNTPMPCSLFDLVRECTAWLGCEHSTWTGQSAHIVVCGNAQWALAHISMIEMENSTLTAVGDNQRQHQGTEHQGSGASHCCRGALKRQCNSARVSASLQATQCEAQASLRSFKLASIAR
jgi:hypothetical protein